MYSEGQPRPCSHLIAFPMINYYDTIRNLCCNMFLQHFFIDLDVQPHNFPVFSFDNLENICGKISLVYFNQGHVLI